MLTIRAVVSLFSTLLFSVAILSGQNTGAMLYAHGNATLNGQPIESSTSIFAGDRLETAESSVATINRNGASIVVNPNSSVQYDQSSIQVLHGTARLSTLAGMSAKVGELTITPENGTAKFDIVASDKGTSVITREGLLTLKEGGRTVTLQPGTTTLFATSGGANAVSAPTIKEASVLPVEKIHSFDTVLTPDPPICSRVSLCFGVGDASETQPCRCRP